MKFFPVLKIYDSGLFFIHICPHKSLVEHLNESGVRKCSHFLLLSVRPHYFLRVSPADGPHAEHMIHRSLRGELFLLIYLLLLI